MSKHLLTQTDYVVKVNEEFAQNFDSLREARSFVNTIHLSSTAAKIVEIVKRTTVYSLMNVYKPKEIKTLVAKDLSLE